MRSLALVIQKEKCFVPLHGAAQASAEFVLLVGRSGRGRRTEEIPGIENIVA